MTTTHTHTGGPWRVGKHDETLGIYDMAENYRLATIEEWRGEHEGESEANARLIAAAPDMLDALREMLSMFGDHEQYDDDSAQVIAQTRQVIAKAEGRDA